MDINWVVNFLAAAIVAGTPLLLATLGEIVIEKSGSLNLGVEGMMYMGAVLGFQMSIVSLSPMLSVTFSLIGGIIGAMIFGVLTISLKSNQIVTGLTLTIFGTGFAGFIGDPIVGTKAPQIIIDTFAKYKIPLLGDVPIVGRILFHQDILTYTSYMLFIAIGLYLYKTRVGLNGRIVGENPLAADSLGISVYFYRYLHLIIGGALCGLAGGYIALVYVPSWQESLMAGRGWIAIALVIFSKWNPYRAILGAVFFGGLDIVGLRLQRFGLPLSEYFFDVLPYLMTIVVMILGSLRKKAVGVAPNALGTPYYREEQ